MNRCSVCSKLMTDSLICPNCKFDSSLDYEMHLTLAPVTGNPQSASEVRHIREMEQKREAEKAINNVREENNQLKYELQQARASMQQSEERIEYLEHQIAIISKANQEVINPIEDSEDLLLDSFSENKQSNTNESPNASAANRRRKHKGSQSERFDITQRYSIGEMIGKGPHGETFKAFDKPDLFM